MTYIEAGTRNYRRTVVCMLLGSMVTFANLYSPQTLIGIFAEQFRVSPSTASFIISFATMTLAVSLLVVSVFSNAWSRKGMMCASLFMTSGLAIASSFSPSFHTLLVIRLLEGISLAGFPAIAITYLNEEVAPGSIGKAMGVYIGGNAAGGLAGRVIVSGLTDLFSWQAAFLALGLLSLGCSVLFWRYLPKSGHFAPSHLSFAHWFSGFKGGFRDKKLLALYGIGFLLMGSYVTLFNYLGYPLSRPPYDWSQTVIGLLFFCQLAGSWSSLLFGRLADRYSRSILLALGIACLLGGSLFTLEGDTVFMIGGIILAACGFFAGHTVASGWVGRTAPDGMKAYASSLYLLFYYSGSSLIGWSGGFFLASFGWPGVVVMLSALLALTALLIIPLNRSAGSSAASS